MTPWSHFMPFSEPNETAEILDEFFERHDRPGVEPITTAEDLAPILTSHSLLLTMWDVEVIRGERF